jgi:dihydroflavonol-4-reductase
VLVRPGSDRSNLHGLDLELCEGDLLDKESLLPFLQGCDTLYHAAADYRLWAKDPVAMLRTNVEGTRAILGAARQAGTEKIVYTSSVGTLGNPGDGTPGDETTPVSLRDMVGHYKKSKFLAERVAERFAAEGLPVVIVNPSTPIGPYDVKPTPTGRIIVDFLNGRMPAFLDTGLNFMDVADCARGHILAARKGVVGEKYILGHVNMTLKELFALVADITGVPAPRIRLPYYPVLVAAYFNGLLSVITGREPLIPLAGVQMAKKYMYFDPSRAIRELGLPVTPVRDSLVRGIEWFRDHGYLK